eukprot:TRINITY_DN112723_c0_g1_i1.p1 TRINITY_DN112723_c0_g1~~TRINITY_DN112723_c0_g1_i1.p1  ORF type:complete len:721 (-),score=205.04 TRINITY_DN112723_c0_g1_i1:97-2193(-)
MQEDCDASEGFDLLGLALGRVPGASDLDEFVEFHIYFDGARKAAELGEAVPYLRARLCEIFELLSTELNGYLWHRDRFTLDLDLGGDGKADEAHLVGHLRTGDGAEDEWFVVHLLQRYTQLRGDVSCRVLDADGELLLIETALAAPRWLEPGNAEHRCWLRGGKVHILPRPRPPEPDMISCAQGLSVLRSSTPTVAKEKVQQAIKARLNGYPTSALELSKHVARAVLPETIARILLIYPQLVAVAVDHLPPAPSQELSRLRRVLSKEEAAVAFSCEELQPADMVCVGVRFTKCQYARLVGLHCQLPQRFTQKHWKTPPGFKGDEKAMRLGQMLCAGLETAFLQSPQAATATLCWPQQKFHAALLPPVAPWWMDSSFRKWAEQLEQPLSQTSVGTRLAFAQQEQVEAPFRRSFLHAINDASLGKALDDFAEHWRDRDDTEEWLHISSEEIDREMAARQAEFDAYDQRVAASSSTSKAVGAQAAADGIAPDAEKLQKEVAAMGQHISELLEQQSGATGVDISNDNSSGKKSTASTAAPGERDSDSDVSADDDEVLDVLGMEEGDDSEDDDEDEQNSASPDGGGDFRTYLSELDEQLAGTLDADAPQDASAKGGSLPLHSHHVRVHDAAPVELDVHAMEHLLASFCSEQQLEPGPASLLLGELGLSKVGRGEAAVRGGYSAGRPAEATAAPQALDSLDGMD